MSQFVPRQIVLAALAALLAGPGFALAGTQGGQAGEPAIGSAPQAIVWAPISGRATVGGADLTLNARANGGGVVSYQTTTSTVCNIVDGRKLRFLSAGTCTVTASQSGTATHAAATDVTQTFVVEAALSRTIWTPGNNFGAGAVGSTRPLRLVLSGGEYVAEAVSDTPSVCTLAARPAPVPKGQPRFDITVVSAGTCTLRARHVGTEFAKGYTIQDADDTLALPVYAPVPPCPSGTCPSLASDMPWVTISRDLPSS